MTDKLEIMCVRAKGGYLMHAKLKGKWGSLCGHRPFGPKAHVMKDRSGWVEHPTEGVDCPKCLKKLEKMK